jgi:hypothetical protein
VYKLTEHVKNDGQSGKRGEDDKEFDVADTCETGEGEVLQGEDRCQVSCHCEGAGDKLTRPKDERYKTEKSIVPLSRLGRRRIKSHQIIEIEYRIIHSTRDQKMLSLCGHPSPATYFLPKKR